MDFLVFFSCISLACGVVIVLAATEKTQITKDIDLSTGFQITLYVFGIVLIIGGIFGFVIGLRSVFARHKKHLADLHEKEQKRKQTAIEKV